MPRVTEQGNERLFKELLMMDCLHSMTPNDETLLRYALDDELLPRETQSHLGQCVICQQRIADYKDLNKLLISRQYRSECPSAMDLNFFCEHLLPIDDIRRIDRHIRQCPLCAAEFADIRCMLVVCEPLPGAIPLPCAVPVILKRVVASIAQIQSQVITRSETPARSWPRQYRAESINISLHLSRGSKGEIVLLGLFTSDDPDESVDAFEGTMAELYPVPHPVKGPHEQTQGDGNIEQPLMSTLVDDLGNLVFRDVPTGTYIMIVHLPDSELVLEGLTVEQRYAFLMRIKVEV